MAQASFPEIAWPSDAVLPGQRLIYRRRSTVRTLRSRGILRDGM